MNVREICERLRSGTIKLNYAGHRYGVTKELLLERYDDNVALSNGSNDGKWGRIKDEPENVDQINADMREFYTRYLDREIGQEDTLRWSNLHDHRVCFNCGQSLHWTLTGDELVLRNYFEEDPKHKRGYEWVNHPIGYTCPLADPKPYTGEITVTSPLVITNFFRMDDTPEGQNYGEEYSLETIIGRMRRADFKAKNQNVAYGQMSNMSIAVYVNDSKDSIIIGPSYHPAEFGDYETDEEWERAMSVELFPGYTKLETICLDVWRWEATDLNTLQRHNIELDEDRDSVVIDAPHGVWKFQHNYDIIRRTKRGDGEKKFDYVFAKLELIK